MEPLVFRNFLLSSLSLLFVELHTDTIAEYASAPETYSETSLGRICLHIRIVGVYNHKIMHVFQKSEQFT